MPDYLAHSTGDHRALNALARAPNNESLEAEFERAVQIEVRVAAVSVWVVPEL